MVGSISFQFTLGLMALMVCLSVISSRLLMCGNLLRMRDSAKAFSSVPLGIFSSSRSAAVKWKASRVRKTC
ncbi:hypothetical protein D3C84_1201590 [compost metagenome]